LTVALETLAAPSPNAMATGPFGSSIGTKTFRDHGVPVLRGSNLSADVGVRLIDDGLVFIEPELAARFSRSVATDGDLVFTCWGTVNQVGLIDHRARHRHYIVSNKQMKFTADPRKALPLFLYYWFSSPAGQADILSGSIGSSVPGFNLGQLRKMQVPLPTLGKQRAIASILGALDDKIELNRRMNETLEAMARAIFQDWFVAFGPTRAKMEGRPPTLAPDLWALFPDRLDAEGKPEGWTSATLARLADLNPESWSSRTMPSTIEYLDLSGCKSGEIQELQTLTCEAAPSRAQRVLRPGDTVVGTVRPGNRSFALISRNGITGTTGFAVLRPKHAGYREFLYLAATADEAIAFLAHRADGAAYPAVRPDVVAGLPSIWVSHSLLLAFSGLVAPLIDRMIANRAEAETLAATRDLLLPRLMSGELRVRDAGPLVAEVA
jgi:type I restriction enzyme S subunit